MFWSSLKVALRYLRQNKEYSVINIFGLAIGMACCILIAMYVIDELSFDRYNENADRIYRVQIDVNLPGRESSTAKGSPLLGPALVEEYPEILSAVRFRPPQLSWTVGYKDNVHNETGFVFADSSVFDIFTLPLVKGDSETALVEPYTVVISEAMAEKYFGDEDPIGKVISADNHFADFTITGVFRDMPANSHVHFEFLPSFSSLSRIYSERYVTNPGNSSFFTYILLKEGTVASELSRKLPDLVGKLYGPILGSADRAKEAIQLHLQPLTDIHLHSHLDDEIGVNSDISVIYIFSFVGMAVLLIAGFNFINLSTAQAAKRAKEVGMRKIVGAFKIQLVRQFILESVLLSLLAFSVAAFFVYLVLPSFNSLSGKSLTWAANVGLWLTMISVAIVVGVLAGAYPAFALSSFRPIDMLKGKSNTGSKKSKLRMGLITTQFSIAIFFMVGTAVVSDQIHFMKNKRLGFDKEQLIIVPFPNREAAEKYPIIRNILLQNDNIVDTTISSDVPGESGRLQFNRTGVTATGENGEITGQLHYLVSSTHFIDTYGIELLEGRNFSDDIGTDLTEAVIVNEAAVNFFGWDSPLGKPVDALGRKSRIVGVVKDFNFKSLHSEIEPLVLLPNDAGGFGTSMMSIRIRPTDVESTLNLLEKTWQTQVPGWAFEYSFLDQEIDKLYRLENQLETIGQYFTFVAAFIACLGLFGLASYVTSRRNKELGIRKVLGASFHQIFILLTREFLMLAIVAAVIAWPITYFVMDRWLQDFAYRTQIGFSPFVLAGLIAMLIALLAVSFHSIKAANTNPAGPLKYE